MGIEENKALVNRFWSAFSAGRYDEVIATLTEDATWWVAGTTALSGTYTKKAFAELLGGVTAQAPKGIQITPTGITAEGNRVAVEAKSYAEITNGRTYQNLYHFLLEIRDGKICAVREYLDTEHVTTTFAP